MRVEEEQEETKQRDYEQDLLEATVESLLAKWEGVEPFRFGVEPQETQETPPISHPTGAKVKGLAVLNIIKYSLMQPNRPTVISKETGTVIRGS